MTALHHQAMPLAAEQLPKQLVLGTHNVKKGRELADLLAAVDTELLTLADFPKALHVEETGDSFADNAELKAVEQARHLGCWVLGEDSGICVDALDGRPGVYSARYSGPAATDSSNNELLIEELGDLPPAERTAHYVCQIVIADPRGERRARSQGRCFGRIRRKPSGDAGFGYDPLFEVVEYGRTFAELGDAVKSLLSHRARAVHRLFHSASPHRRA